MSVVTEGADIGGVLIPEVQALTLDLWYPGVYRLQRGLRVTPDLSVDDGPAQIQAAVQNLLSAGEKAQGATLTVTNPAAGVAHITFGGYLAGVDEDLLEVVTVSSGTADPVINLSLDNLRTAAALRAGAREFELELVWRVREETAEEPGDEVIRQLVGYRGTVQVVPQLGHASLETLQDIDWVRPPVPRTYVPFSHHQLLVGTRHYVGTVTAAGDTEITHGLGTDALQVTVVDDGGSVLPLTGGLAVEIGSGTVTVTAPAGASYPLSVLLSGVSADDHFLAHTHTLGDVPEAAAAIAALQARVADLEELRPLGLLSLPETTALTVARWTLPVVEQVLPLREAVAIPAGGLAALDVSGIRAGGLLPAVTTTTAATSLPVPVPPKPTTEQSGKIWVNNSGAELYLPGSYGRRGTKLAAGALAAAWRDAAGNAAWYPVSQLSGTSTYYPTDMDVPLFEFAVRAEQLQPGRRLTIGWGIEAAVFASLTRGIYQLRVEWGAPAGLTTPGTPGPNLSEVTWDTANPALAQTIYITPIPSAHQFAVSVAAALVGETVTLTAERTRYGKTEAAQAPAGTNFWVRGRLCEWDLLDAPAIRGLVAVRGCDVSLTEGEETGVATIK
jgi:hypothetical protein